MSRSARVDVLPSYEKAVRDLSGSPPPYTATVGVVLPSQNRISTGAVIAPVNANGANANGGLCGSLRFIGEHFVQHKLAMIIAVIFILLSSLSMAALVVGARDRNKCPVESKGAIWLIVFGVVGFVWCWTTVILTIARTFLNDRSRSRCHAVLILIFILMCAFNIAWTIVHFKWASSDSDSEHDNQCGSLVKYFALGLSSIMGLTICCVLGICASD